MSMIEMIYSFEPRAEPAAFHEDDDAFFVYEDVYQRKYRHWRGRSGRSYVFSVYAPLDCPAYENAVLIVARPGQTRAIACVDMGASPDEKLVELLATFANEIDDVQFQIHVLAERDDARRALIDDLTARAA